MPADDIVKFLDTNLYTLVFLATFFVVLLGELRWPRRRDKSPLRNRWRTNFLLYFVNLLFVYLIFPVSAVAVSMFAVEAKVGVFQWLQTPYLPAFVLGILIMDFTKYLQHYLMHHIPLLWRFHRAHHADTACDVTTSLRFHPGEALLSGAVDLLVILCLGIPPLAVACYRVARIGISTLVHGNIGLGAWLEPKLRAFIVTPDLHRVHHSCLMRETNSNYSGGLIWWDRLFGTYCPQPQGGHAAMRIGIDGYPVQRAHSLRLTLTDPFAAND